MAYAITSGENVLIRLALYILITGQTYRGVWSSVTAYVVDDVVLGSDGIAYVSILAGTNHAPPNATYWAALAPIPIEDITAIYADLFKDDTVAVSWIYSLGAAQASGALVTGRRYVISDFIAGDDFTNVGAASNATGVSFVATGTTPTTWSNSSVLKLMNGPDNLLLEAGLLTMELTKNVSALLDGDYELRLFLSTLDTDYLSGEQTNVSCFPAAISATPC